MKNSIFARFARAFFIFWHFVDVPVLSTTWNDPFCSCVDDVSIWWRMFNFVFLCPKHWFQINSRTVRRYFSSIMTLNNWKMIAETRSYILRWRSRFRWRRVCLKCLWNEIFYYLIRKSFQNDEEWRLFYCDSTFGCWVIQDFDLCKLDDLWRHRVDTKWCKITKYWISLQVLSLQGWNFPGLMYCNNYTFW